VARVERSAQVVVSFGLGEDDLALDRVLERGELGKRVWERGFMHVDASC
jgi:hypothetical protein